MCKILAIGVLGLLLILPLTAFSQSLFAPPVNYPAGPLDGFGITGADFDGDGDVDLANTRWLAGGAVGILMNNGDGVLLPPILLSLPYEPGELVAADFDGDSDIDLAVRAQMERVCILKNNGDGTFLAPQYIYIGRDGQYIAAGDIDNDGDIDLVASTIDDGALVFKNNGNATFATPTKLSAGKSIYGVYLGNFDNDGNLDLALLNYEDSALSIWLNSGTGTFDFHADYPTGTGPWSISGGDLDGDSDIDLAVIATEARHVRVFLNDGDGGFDSYSTLMPSSGEPVGGICLADFDSDGDLDVAAGVCGLGQDLIDLFLNDGSGDFPTKDTYYIGHGIPFSLFASDLDSDSDIDLAFTGVLFGVGVMLNTTTSIPADVFPPAAASDFRIGDVQPNSVLLLWTAPGDNGVVGTASGYDIRYATEPITDDNWALATQVANEPQPQVAGSAESMVIDNLTSLVTYYFAIKTSDEVGNISGISNVISATTAFRCGDSNRDGVFNILDAIYLIRNLYKNGPPPSCQ